MVPLDGPLALDERHRFHAVHPPERMTFALMPGPHGWTHVLDYDPVRGERWAQEAVYKLDKNHTLDHFETDADGTIHLAYRCVETWGLD